MKSDVIHVNSDGSGRTEVLDQVERVAAFKNLDRKNTLHLRLLAEEMMGMLSSITSEVEADFWIEGNEGDFSLHLVTETVMHSEKREKLLSVSSSGSNAAAKGVMGKIRDIFTRAFEPMDGSFMSSYAAQNAMYYDMGMGGSTNLAMQMWSLNQYKEELEKNDRQESEEWDELEKSIVANIADEVEVYIREGEVEMVIYKRF